ncbi:MAG: helix-turn-helix domain-containing protein, partial [Solirubrobacterales bacterium]
AGLSQAELARRIETTQSAVARLESPHSNPRFGTLQRALSATGNSIAISLAPSGYPAIDETLIASNLRLSPADRLRAFTIAYDQITKLAPTRREQSGP